LPLLCFFDKDSRFHPGFRNVEREQDAGSANGHGERSGDDLGWSDLDRMPVLCCFAATFPQTVFMSSITASTRTSRGSVETSGAFRMERAIWSRTPAETESTIPRFYRAVHRHCDDDIVAVHRRDGGAGAPPEGDIDHAAEHLVGQVGRYLPEVGMGHPPRNDHGLDGIGRWSALNASR